MHAATDRARSAGACIKTAKQGRYSGSSLRHPNNGAVLAGAPINPAIFRTQMLPTSQGVAYLPDGVVSESPAPPPRTLLLQIVLFLAVFIALQTAYGAVRHTWIERLLIDTLTVKPAASLIRAMSPEIPVRAEGTRLKALGGGINILNGCEGTEVLFMLHAAFAAAAISWRARLAGLFVGTLLVYALNQVRVLALFHAYRSDKALFDMLHGTVAPLILTACVTLFFFFWLERHGPPTERPAVA